MVPGSGVWCLPLTGRESARAGQIQDSVRSDTDLNIRMHFEKFLDGKISATMDLSLSCMEINPFLMAVAKSQLGLKSPEDLARLMITQWLERSMSTSFGSTLQNIVREFTNQKPPRDLTARLVRDGITYNMIVKAGPNHNVQVANNIRAVLLKYQEADPDSVSLFGSCYGREGDMGQIMKKTLADMRVLVGRSFWEFISQDAGCYDKIAQIASQVGASYQDPDAGSLEDVIAKKAECIAIDLKEIYGHKSEDFWRNILGGRA